MSTIIINNKVAIVLEQHNGFYKCLYGGTVTEGLYFFCEQLNCYVGFYVHESDTEHNLGGESFYIHLNDIKSDNDMGLKNYQNEFDPPITMYHVTSFFKDMGITAYVYRGTKYPIGSPTLLNNEAIFDMLKMSLPKNL